jgi:hypothetical protein
MLIGLIVVKGNASEATKMKTAATTECGLWLGPSHWKDAAEHGYGLGMYTGKFIAKGTLMASEPFVPLFDFLTGDTPSTNDGEDDGDAQMHPPLREFLWDGIRWKRHLLESYQGLLFFSPGLAAIAPCTSENYHLEIVPDYDGTDYNMEFDNGNVARRPTDPTTGSFAYYRIRMFRAVRDIQAGEELTVECSDDSFDASSWDGDLMTYSATKHTCLDDKVESKPSTIPSVGQGVYAKQTLAANSVIITSPAVPVHRRLLDIMDSHKPPRKISYQLLINYCIGHPDSDLLWLPYAPWINSINHYAPPATESGTKTANPNVKLVWHKQQDPTLDNSQLARRQQYHHPELLDFSPERVATTHGKGLVLDVVALRDIQEGEELLLDYGSAWTDAWKKHSTRWSSISPDKLNATNYVSAFQFNQEHTGPLRTITEQHKDPYPHNILTACRFEKDWIDDENAEDYDMIQYQSWNTQEADHFNCLLPCLILERLPGSDDGTIETTYTAKLVDHHHEHGTCHKPMMAC